MSNWKEIFVGGGMQVVTLKAAFPQLTNAPLPDILIKTMVQHDGDIMNEVEQKLLTSPEYRDLLPEIWAAHFAKVESSLPNFTVLDQLMRIWSWVLGAVGMIWGVVRQFMEDDLDWEALWPAIAGVGVVALRYLAKWILRLLVKRGFEKLKMPNEEDAEKWEERVEKLEEDAEKIEAMAGRILKRKTAWLVVLIVSAVGTVVSIVGFYNRLRLSYGSEGQYFDPETGVTYSDNAVVVYALLGGACLILVLVSLFQLKKNQHAE